MFNELKTSRMRQEQCGDVSFVCRIHDCGKLRTTTNTLQHVHRINLTKTKIHVSEKKKSPFTLHTYPRGPQSLNSRQKRLSIPDSGHTQPERNNSKWNKTRDSILPPLGRCKMCFLCKAELKDRVMGEATHIYVCMYVHVQWVLAGLCEGVCVEFGDRIAILCVDL